MDLLKQTFENFREVYSPVYEVELCDGEVIIIPLINKEPADHCYIISADEYDIKIWLSENRKENAFVFTSEDDGYYVGWEEIDLDIDNVKDYAMSNMDRWIKVED